MGIGPVAGRDLSGRLLAGGNPAFGPAGEGGRLRFAGTMAGVLAASVCVGVLSSEVDSVLLPAGILMVATLALAVRAPRTVALATLLALPFLGFVRRISGSYTARVDPLALAAPMLAVVCVFVLTARARPRRRTPLTVAVSAMVGLGVVQILNPAQGGLGAGVLGAGLFVGPMVWFYIGHRIGDERTLLLVVRALRVIVIVTAAYGVNQLLFGLTGFETAWVAARRADYAALDISGNVRPFSTFSSGAEYSYFLALGALLFAVGAGPMRRVARTVVIAAFVLACFYSGSRTIFVTAVLSVLIVAVVQRIRSLSKALTICIVIGAVALVFVRLLPLATDESTAGAIRNRTLTGLARPFDRESSTLPLHLDAFVRGMRDGLRTPLGRGAATVNLAGVKSGTKVVSAEQDIPNTLLAYGWAGAVCLALLMTRVYRVLRSCVRHRRRRLLAPAAFVLGTFGVWFVGELYAASAVIWFFMGSIDRLDAEAEAGEHPAAPGGGQPSLVAAAG